MSDNVFNFPPCAPPERGDLWKAVVLMLHRNGKRASKAETVAAKLGTSTALVCEVMRQLIRAGYIYEKGNKPSNGQHVGGAA